MDNLQKLELEIERLDKELKIARDTIRQLMTQYGKENDLQRQIDYYQNGFNYYLNGYRMKT